MRMLVIQQVWTCQNEQGKIKDTGLGLHKQTIVFVTSLVYEIVPIIFFFTDCNNL